MLTTACTLPREPTANGTAPVEQADQKPDAYEDMSNQYSAFKPEEESLFSQRRLLTVDAQELVEKTRGKPWASEMIVNDIYRKGDQYHIQLRDIGVRPDADAHFDLIMTKEKCDQIRPNLDRGKSRQIVIVVYYVDSVSRGEFGIHTDDPNNDGNAVPRFSADSVDKPIQFVGTLVDFRVETTE
jgi:hypothetical protein